MGILLIRGLVVHNIAIWTSSLDVYAREVVGSPINFIYLRVNDFWLSQERELIPLVFVSEPVKGSTNLYLPYAVLLHDSKGLLHVFDPVGNGICIGIWSLKLTEGLVDILCESFDLYS